MNHHFHIQATAATALLATLVSAPSAAQGGEHAVIAVEAESFLDQRKTSLRRWEPVAVDQPRDRSVGRDRHEASASGGAYLEVLPDTRRTHDDQLIRGENFSNKPGEMAVLDYGVTFDRAGRYYVWVRAFSTGSEDNSIHVGLNGEWPASGARMQWCKGKRQWWWESRQRTKQEHCGVPHAIYLDVPTAGVHTVSFSMREDGFKFDKFLLTTNRDLERPTGVGPQAIARKQD